MNAARILETLNDAGITVRRDGDKLTLKATTGALPADLVELARQHKRELLRLLPDTCRPAANILHKPCDLVEQRRRLIEAARAQGFPADFIRTLPDEDIEGTQWLSPQGVARYAEILAARQGRPHAKT